MRAVWYPPGVVPIWLLRSLMLWLMLVFMVPSCSKATREKALDDTFTALNASRDAFLAWDRDHQDAIIQQATTLEDGQKKLAAYRKARDTVLAAGAVAYAALGLAQAGNDDPSLLTALEKARDLYAAVKNLAATAAAK